MASTPNKLSRFWQELKRRRVVHVITVYASAAFVIIELVNNLTEPLNLPSALSTIVIIVLTVGFPLAIVLSWIYDITAGAFERTKPLEDLAEKETIQVPNAWKIATYISFIVIAGLIVLNIASRSDLIKPGMIQSVAILPFSNYTGDDNLDYVAAGMHASLITDMAKVSALRVTGETSSKTYKNTDKSAPMIGEELNVDLLIEPTLTCYGDSVCVLIRGVTTNKEEKQILVREYMVDRDEILSFYPRVVKEISHELKVELSPEELRLLSKSIIVDRQAYEAYLRGNNYAEDLSHESLIKARDYLNSAIEKDPDWAPLYGAMATVWLSIGSMGVESPEIAIPVVYEYLNKALELDPDLAEAHYVSAFMAFAAEWDWEKAEKEFLKALAINPNHVFSRIHYSHMLYILQRPDEAQIQADLAYRLDPLNPLIQSTYALTLLCENDCASALSVIEKVLVSDPDNFLANNVVDAAAFQCGDLDRVFEAEKQKQPLEEGLMNEIERIYNKNGFHAAYEEIMRHLEVLAKTNYFTPADMAFKYYMINQDDKAMAWIEKGVEVHDPSTLYIGSGYYNYTRLYDNPRFIKVFEKLNLPLPKTN